VSQAPHSLSRGRVLLLAGPPLAFVGLFFVYPVVRILAEGLAPDGDFDLRATIDVMAQPLVRDVAWFTLWQAVASTLLTVLIALPGAYAFARFEFPGRRLINAVALVPFVLPTVVVAAAFVAVLGPRGPLAQVGIRLDNTIWAILLAHVFYNYAVVLRVVGAAWRSIDPRLEDAARALGATRWQAFRRVTLPLLRPAIASASSIVFLFTFTSFAVILVLGGPQFSTIEVEIYRQAAQLLDLRTAAVLALLQLAALALLLLAYARYQERSAVRTRPVVAHDVGRKPHSIGEKSLVAANLLVMAVLLGLPLALLVERSLSTGSGYGLGYYTSLFDDAARSALAVPPIQAIGNSLLYAVIATLVAATLGAMASQVIATGRGRLPRAFDVLLTLPLGTSAVILGFGFLVSLGTLPIDLRTSPWLVPIAHSLVALPFVIRAVTPALRSLDRRLHEAAAVLGASPSRTWRVLDLPLIAGALLVGAGFAFAVSLGEFGATLFIIRPDNPTMPIAVYRLLGQPGSLAFGQAMAMATLLMVAVALSALVIDRVRFGTRGFV
jgi:thiamine transport system permease protein